MFNWRERLALRIAAKGLIWDRDTSKLVKCSWNEFLYYVCKAVAGYDPNALLMKVARIEQNTRQ